MKTPLYSTLSSLAVLTATAIFLSTACPALGEGSSDPNNPDKICKYKKKGCDSCQGGQCSPSSAQDQTMEKKIGHNETCPDTITVGASEEYELVGQGTATRSAKSALPSITIKSGFSADFVNPKNLNIYGQGADVVRDGNANIRQVKTDTGFLDVIFTPETKTMELRQYKPEDIGTSKVKGLYPVKNGKAPIVVLRYVQEADNILLVDTINNTSEFPSVNSERTVQTVGPKPYTLSQQKTYIKGEGLSSVEYRRVSKTITGIPGGQPKEEQYFYTTEDMGTDGAWHVTERKAGRRAEYKKEDGLVMLYECDAVNEAGVPVAPIATETSYTYYTDPLQMKSYGKRHTLRRNDGYWENKYYDDNANAGIEIEKTERPWLNTAAHEPGATPAGKIRVREEVWCSTDSGIESVTETVDGISIAREWTEKSPVNQKLVKEVRHQPHSGGDKVTTTVRYRRAKDVPSHLTGKAVSIHHADGSMSLYSYGLNGQDLTITEDTGYGEGDSVSHGTRTIITQDKDSGNLKEEVRYALQDGQAHWLGSRTGTAFDKSETCLKWVYDNNPDDYTEQRKDCCHVTWERGRDGIETTYTYDAAGRIISATSRGITSAMEYKGLTVMDWQQITGGAKKYLTKEITRDLAGNIIEEKQPTIGGKILTTKFRFNVAAKSSTTTTPYGTMAIRIFFADGQVLRETGTTGLIQTYTYTPTVQNGGGLTIAMTDGNRSRMETINLLGNAVFEQSGNNALTQHSYDAAGRIIKITLPDGEIQLYVYKEETQISGIDLNSDGVLNLAHDRMTKSERVFDSSWPEGKGAWKTTVKKAWQGNWLIEDTQWKTEDETLSRGKKTGVEGYRLNSISPIYERGQNYQEILISPSGQKREINYTFDKGSVSSISVIEKTSDGNVTASVSSTKNVWGHVLTRADVRTGTVNYTHDTDTGATLSMTIPGNLRTSYEYDEYGRLVATILPDCSQQHVAYDNENNIIRQWGSQQYPVSYEYDVYGQKTGMTTYRVPVDDRTTWPEGVAGDKTTWIYDAVTRNILKKTYADGKGVSNTYTPGGKLLTQSNARGNVTTFCYDSAGQLVLSWVNDNGITPTKTFAYDQFGRQMSAVTEGIADYQYSYNEQGQVSEEQITIPTSNGSLVRTLTRNYDSYGRASSCQLRHAEDIEQQINYTYNTAGLLDKLTADGKEFTYSYIPNSSRLIAQVIGPVHTVTNTYEANRNILVRKTNRWKNKLGAPVISAYTYEMNNLGQRISVSTEGEAFGPTPANCSWGYDALGQVVSANEESYSYDQIGNRISSRKDNFTDTNYTTNALNQYTQIGNINPTYDADGNQLSGFTPTDTIPDRNSFSLAYNAENNPVSISRNGEVQETYDYDHIGRRIKKGNIVTLYDEYNAIAEYDLNKKSLKQIYSWGIDLGEDLQQQAGGVGGLLSVTDYNTQIPLVSYPSYDGNGNITEYLTEENLGAIYAHYEYDSFGNSTDKSKFIKNTYQFSTKPYDNKMGLNYYNYRYYNSSVGRWANRDFIGEDGGDNLYGFIQNDGVNVIDYLGFAECCNKKTGEKKTYYPEKECCDEKNGIVKDRKECSTIVMVACAGEIKPDEINNIIKTEEDKGTCVKACYATCNNKETNSKIKACYRIPDAGNTRNDAYIFPDPNRTKDHPEYDKNRGDTTVMKCVNNELSNAKKEAKNMCKNNKCCSKIIINIKSQGGKGADWMRTNNIGLKMPLMIECDKKK